MEKVNPTYSARLARPFQFRSFKLLDINIDNSGTYKSNPSMDSAPMQRRRQAIQ